MSKRLDKNTTRKILMTAFEHGTREASRRLASEGLKYSHSRIAKIAQDRSHLSTVFMFSEIDKCKGFGGLQKLYKKEFARVLGK